jgi:hypothetical protein
LNDRSSLSELLSRARRRHLAHLVADRSALALTAGMGGAVLLLLAGTQILDWYWVVLLAVASLGAGLYRLRKNVPSAYSVAQRIDRRLNLADTLSTAAYFSSRDSVSSGEEIRERQRKEAEAVAATVDIRQGIPFARPRYIYPAIGLAAIAFGLFALRYAMTGSLNLKPSLARIAFDTFFASKQNLAKAERKNLSPGQKQLGTDPDSTDGSTVQNDPARDPDPAADPADANNPAQKQAKADSAGQPPDPGANDQGDKKDQGDRADNGANPDSKDGPQGDNSKNGKEQSANQNSKQGNSSDSSSLMDKMRDAVSNMLAKMQSRKDGQQPGKNGQRSGQQEKSNQQDAQAQKGDQAAEAGAKSEQQGEGDEQKQSADTGAEKGADKQASQDSKSGIGSADGSKNARQAEQLAAMGKISEILGKRSATVTGEVMVEVGSSKQQLKTPWGERQATHTEAGGEIHRDEVPLMYQQFVQQYFEEIRKAPATGASKRHF